MTAMTAKVYIVYFLPWGRWSLFCPVPVSFSINQKIFCCDKPTKESNTDRSVTTLKESIVVTGIREIMMGVGDGVASVIMLTFTKMPGPHAHFYKDARPPC